MREKRFRRRAARVFATIFALIVVAMVGTIVAFPVAARHRLPDLLRPRTIVVECLRRANPSARSACSCY